MDLEDVLRRIAETADYAEVVVDGPNARGNFGDYPLHVAAVWGDCEAIRILVAAGARIDQPGEHGYTPLMEAVEQGHSEAAMLLIALGAQPVRNDDGALPSEHAELLEQAELSARLARLGF